MKAKDTVMNHMDAIDTYNHYRDKYEEEMESLEQPVVQSRADKAGVDGHSLAQAEVSFKAGIREVVEWIEYEYGQDVTEPYTYIIQHGYKRWTDKLREWGIEKK